MPRGVGYRYPSKSLGQIQRHTCDEEVKCVVTRGAAESKVSAPVNRTQWFHLLYSS